MGNDTLVMTATFRPAAGTPSLVVTEERERALHYLCALVAWGRTARVRRIVFGENSNTTFEFGPVRRHLEAAGKEVEFLVFDGNKEVARFGKGYGEGEILEHVVRHSRLLTAAPAFYKVTGRLFVANFDAVSDATPSLEAFQRKVKQPKDGPPRPCKVVTTFFKCSLALFESRLVRAYQQVDDRRNVFIEHVYYTQLHDLALPDFGVRPALVGQQASTGRIYGTYDDDIVRTARSLIDRSASADVTVQKLS